MQLEINYYIDENKKHLREIDTLKRVRDETRTMFNDENRKLLFEAQYYKDKLDKLKTDLYEHKRKNKELERLQTLYDQLKDREDERLK